MKQSFKSALSQLPWVRAGFSTRHGGRSEPPFDSLNLGLSTNDEAVNVASNRRLLLEKAGLANADMAIAGQVHGALVQQVEAGGLYAGVDGLVTANAGVVLCISAADCAAVLFADPSAGVIGACHAGWRGTVAGVVEETLDALNALEARPADILAYVSPCISVDRFEVGEEVAERFPTEVVVRRRGARPHVDLKVAITRRLLARGVQRKHLVVDPDCTASQTDRYYSYRAEAGNTGRMMGFIAKQFR